MAAFINFDGKTSACIYTGPLYLSAHFTKTTPNTGTGILFVIRGDTFNKVWKCILWNIHIWRSVAGCHGYKRVMYDFPHRSLQQYFRIARKPPDDAVCVCTSFLCSTVITFLTILLLLQTTICFLSFSAILVNFINFWFYCTIHD